MLCKLISISRMPDILILSHPTLFFYNVMNISVLSFSPASSLLLPCILEHSHLLPPDARVLLIQPHSKIFMHYFLWRSYYVSGTLLGARNSAEDKLRELIFQQGQVFLSHPPHPTPFPSTDTFSLTLVPTTASSLLPSAVPRLRSPLCNQDELLKTQFCLPPSSV